MDGGTSGGDTGTRATTNSDGGAAGSGGAIAGTGGRGFAGTGGNADNTGGVQNTGGIADHTGGVQNTGGIADSTGGVQNTGGIVDSTGGLQGTGGEPPVTCPSPTLQPGDKKVTIQGRSYSLHVPGAYDGTKPVPLILDFHGLMSSASEEQSRSSYPAQTDPEGVIMAFPSGTSGPSGAAWNVGPCCVANVDDVAFAKAIVEDIQKTACIDPKRVYAVGYSMGGGLSHYLACHAADVFAAVAPAAFDLLEENVTDCVPSRPISVVSYRCTGDPMVSYPGGYSAVVPGMPITFLGAQGTLEKWAEINQCTGALSENGPGCSTYATCQDGVEVTLCTKQGGGHDPGDASILWPILKKYTLP